MHAFTKRIQGHGRFGDKLLAHLSPKEAKILKKAGGAGTINPFTGALEYYKGTLGGGGVNPFTSEEEASMPTEGATSPSAEGVASTPTDGSSGEQPKAGSAFTNLAMTWQGNQPASQQKLDPRMLNFAKIMQNTYDRDDPGTQGETRPEFYTGESSVDNMLKYTMGIHHGLHDRLIDRNKGGSWNENKAPGRVDEVISWMFSPNSQGNTGFEMFGGQDALLEAYQLIGVTGEGKSYADKHVKKFLDTANSIAARVNESQTSLTMGKEPGPQHTETYTGPNAVKEAWKDMTGPTGFGALAKMWGGWFRIADEHLFGDESPPEDGPFDKMGSGGGGE